MEVSIHLVFKTGDYQYSEIKMIKYSCCIIDKVIKIARNNESVCKERRKRFLYLMAAVIYL